MGECFPQHGPAVCPHLLFGSGLFVLQKVAHAHRPHCHTLGDEVDGAEQQAAAAPDAVHQCAAQKRTVGADRAILVNTPLCKGQPVVAQGTQHHTADLQRQRDHKDRCTALQHIPAELHQKRLDDVRGQDDIDEQVGQALASLRIDDALAGQKKANEGQQRKLALQCQQT